MVGATRWAFQKESLEDDDPILAFEPSNERERP
jgi:hypothetical protein